MITQGNTDIEKAINLLREIQDFLWENPCPEPLSLEPIREKIKGFTDNFPTCWECGDTGFIDAFGDSPCLNCNHI